MKPICGGLGRLFGLPGYCSGTGSALGSYKYMAIGLVYVVIKTKLLLYKAFSNYRVNIRYKYRYKSEVDTTIGVVSLSSYVIIIHYTEHLFVQYNRPFALQHLDGRIVTIRLAWQKFVPSRSPFQHLNAAE